VIAANIIAAAATLTVCCPARADWKYTQWGMTVDQVLAASKGKLRRCSPPVCRAHVTTTSAAQLYGEETDGGFTFTVFALFERWSGRLASIDLRLWKTEQADSLISVVRTKYGEPTSQSHGAILESYVWRAQNDQISILSVRGNQAVTTISYRPNITQESNGKR
jgi:hypothetical protein